MKWQRRGPGWPTPNPGASFSSAVSAMDYPGAEGEWFAYTLNDWVGGTPAEMMRRRVEFEQQRNEIEGSMKSKKVTKKAAKKVTKKALKKASRAPKKLTAKQQWAAEQKQIMEDADAESKRRAEHEAEKNNSKHGVETTYSQAPDGSQMDPMDDPKKSHAEYPWTAEGRARLLKDSENATVPGTVLCDLWLHLNFANNRLAEWETTFAADLEAETQRRAKSIEDAYKADVKSIEDVYKAEAEPALKLAIEQGQNEALKEIARMFGALVEANPEQSFAFLQAQVRLRDQYREKAGGAILDPTEVEKLKTKVLDAEEAKKVVAEQCKVAEKDREAALKAAKSAREFCDRMQKERDAAVSAASEAVNQFKVADEKLVALQKQGSNGHAHLETLAKAFEVVAKNDFDFAKALGTPEGKAIEEAAAALGLL